ncbi:purine NTPase, putative [Legionella lansingensis]|uniref:Purine NTPase n=1 Tax=Legionella lansingensis TaxID=45067 RepID=A0A0W0W1C9_9GAMM|nr:hypothetical protein [Legionella lansingensis]KTD26106.1 purine NTPase [Legionella lansingensis]SNV52597.1 purine NTPase, putative [Legionella lansingensis]
MAYTLTDWWTDLKNDLEKLETKPWVDAARKMATDGIQIEFEAGQWHKTAAETLGSNIDNAAKDLGKSYSNSKSKKDEGLPNVNDPEQFLFAVLYYNHLLRYKKIDSSTTGVTVRGALLSGVRKENDRVEENATEIKRRIDTYCRNEENLAKIKTAFPGITIQQGDSTDSIIKQSANWIKTQTGKIVPHIEEDKEDEDIGDLPLDVEDKTTSETQPKVAEESAPSEVSTTIAKHLTDMFNSKGQSAAGVGEVIAEIDKVNTRITKLIQEKTKASIQEKKEAKVSIQEKKLVQDKAKKANEETLEQQSSKKVGIERKMKAMQGLIDAVEENDKSGNTKTFADLLNEHKKDFLFLMPTKEGALLEEKIASLQNPTYYTSLGNAFSSVTPTFIQTASSRVLPKTQDRDCKDTLKDSAQNYLNRLRQELDTVEKTIESSKKELDTAEKTIERLSKELATVEGAIEDLTKKLAPDETIPVAIDAEDDKKLQDSLANATIDDLEKTQKANEVMKDVLQEYQQLLKEAEEHKELLLQAKSHEAALDKVIEWHDDWFVKLSNWLADNISSWFKTDTAATIDEAHETKKELQSKKEEYERTFEEKVSKVRQEVLPKITGAEESLHEKIPSLPADGDHPPLGQDALEKLKDKTAIEAFRHVKTMFSETKPKESAEIEQHEDKKTFH